MGKCNIPALNLSCPARRIHGYSKAIVSPPFCWTFRRDSYCAVAPPSSPAGIRASAYLSQWSAAISRRGFHGVLGRCMERRSAKYRDEQYEQFLRLHSDQRADRSIGGVQRREL